MQLMVIGLDGGTFKIISKYLDVLPNIKSLIKKGVSGYLKSSIPPVTFPAWKCYSTGKNPGKLGVYSPFHFDPDGDINIKTNDSNSFSSPEIWDYLGAEGKKSVIVNMPITFPPEKIEGCMVSGHPLPSERKKYTFPEEIQKELKNNFNYRVDPELSIKYDQKKGYKEIKELIKTKFEAFYYLIKKYEPIFSHLTVFHLDNIQHYYWDLFEKDRSDNPIKETWKLIDDEIGSLLKKVSDEVNIIIMSDHGFCSLEATFELNTWLYKKGYLKFKNLNSSKKFKNIKKPFAKLINDRTLYNLINSLNLAWIEKYLPKSIEEMIPRERKKDQVFSVYDDEIDIDNTDAVGLSEGTIYVLGKEKKAKKDKIKKELKKVKDPETGKSPFYKIYDVKDLYPFSSDEAPDLILLPKENWRINGEGVENSCWNRKNTGWNGYHSINGIFIAKGPSFKKGEKINPSIYDLAPTILHLLKNKVPISLDGKVLRKTFDSESEAFKSKPIFTNRPTYTNRGSHSENLI